MKYFVNIKKLFVIGTITLSLGMSSILAEGIGICTGSAVNVRTGPSGLDKVVATITKNEEIKIIDKEDDWYIVELSNGDKAYVYSKYIEKQEEMSPDEIVIGTISTDGLNIRSMPSTSASIIGSLNKEDQILVEGVLGDWYKFTIDDQDAWIHKSFVTGNNLDKAKKLKIEPVKETKEETKEEVKEETNSNGQAIVEYAKKFQGTKYVYGGTSLTKGVDCSGFTQQVMKIFQIKVDRTAKSQSNNGNKVNKSDLKAGDLVFFDTSGANTGNICHAGIYIGNGQFIHASSGKANEVTISDLTSGFYKNAYVSGARVIK